MSILILFGVYLGLFFSGIPISFAMGISGIISLLMLDMPMRVLIQNMLRGVESFEILAIPFFILAANIMNEAGITEKIFNFAKSAVGWITGGLGHVNVLASMIFAGISGAATADAAGLGLIEMRAMKDAGYDESFSAGITASSSMLGPIIPPSIVMVVYGHIANVSIGKLFFAGILPGIVGGLLLMSTIYILAKTTVELPKPEKFNLKGFFITLKDGIAGIGAPIIILSGILFGFVTPTEAGILASIYAIIIWLIYDGKSIIKDIPEVLKKTVVSSSLVVFLLCTATPIVWVLTRERAVVKAANLILSLTNNPMIFLIIINLFLILAGCILNQLPALLILVPVLHPLAVQMGLNPVHFGVLMVFNLMIGMITPPFGVGLYILAAISDVPIAKIIRACVPFFIALVVALLLISYIPALTLYLPNIIFRR